MKRWGGHDSPAREKSPFHMFHTSHYKTISDSLLNLGNHLCYCVSAGLFVFIFPLAKQDCFLGSTTERCCLFKLFQFVCLLSAGLRGCQLLVLRVWASQFLVFTLTLIPKPSCSFVWIFISLFISVLSAFGQPLWRTLGARDSAERRKRKSLP